MSKTVKVLYFKMYDGDHGVNVWSKRPATRAAIAEAQGAPIESTEMEIDEKSLDAEGFRRKEIGVTKQCPTCGGVAERQTTGTHAPGSEKPRALSKPYATAEIVRTWHCADRNCGYTESA
jgi:hypothetical protein